MSDQFEDIEGFILAGGASSRMGHDKGHLPWGETTFTERAAAALQTITTKPVVIVGGFGFDESPGKFRFLSDFKSDGETRRAPIFGLRTIFRNSNASWAAILACDLPFVSAELFERLATWRNADFEAVVPVQPDGKWQPLCALYRSAVCLPQVESMLEENLWSLKELLKRIRTRPIPFAEIADLPSAERFFLNVNTPAEYELAMRLKAEDFELNQPKKT